MTLINSTRRQGVSVITCTNRQDFLGNLVRNFTRQLHPKKELIIIVNDNHIPLTPYLQLTKKHKNIRVFRMPEQQSLGACLNYAVRKAKHPYVAKFDDDDYYAPYYLTECLMTFRKTDVDVIGKRAHYMYLQGSRTLLLRFPEDQNRRVARLPGATLVFKKEVFTKVRFPNRSVGEDDLFCLRSIKEGFRVYSAGKYNFVAIRRRNSSRHTWVISDGELIAHHRTIPNVRNYKRYVRRKPV